MNRDAAEWKRHVRARLASARAALLFALLGIPRRALEAEIVAQDLTAAQILFLIASEDRARALALERVLHGDEPRLEVECAAQGSLSDALDSLLASRAELLSAFARIAPAPVGGSETENSLVSWIEESEETDGVSANLFAEWRAARGEPEGGEPRELLIAAARAARKELLTEIALIPEEQRPSWPVRGRAEAETLTEAVLYTARQEWHMEQNVRWVMGQARAEEPNWPTDWHGAWRQLHDVHHLLIRRLEQMPEDVLNRPAGSATGTAYRPYEFYRMQVARDRWLTSRLQASRQTTPL
jgi:hypothetical protein